LVDLINAETEMQRKQALAQMEGSLSVLYKKWRQQICKCLANVEAYIDFYEEENLEENILEEGYIYLRFCIIYFIFSFV
jgi:tRNA U34 5-carboxymethylaminomethyl modifying GTPase MnmE/TrmE